VRCHAGFKFTDEGDRNIGVGMDKAEPDLGRYTVTNNEADKGAFKTSTLRDVDRRGPYMHDGSARTIEEVVAFYNRGEVKNPWLHRTSLHPGLSIIVFITSDMMVAASSRECLSYPSSLQSRMWNSQSCTMNAGP
jgi:cytochrome c peroxidase